MLLAALLLISALPLGAQFIRVEVAFQGTGCASCIESLEGRLSRVRGVERVELDVKQEIVTLHLAAENRVRLTPLLSRITQDGTKVLRARVVVRGTIAATEEGYVLKLAQPPQTYRLRLAGDVPKTKLHSSELYTLEAVLSGKEALEDRVLEIESISPED